MMIEKPEPVIQSPALNYFACRDYINDKYDIDMVDYYKDETYHSFWHHLIDYDAKNDTYLYMCDDYQFLVDVEDWYMEIYQMFFKEFGEYADENGCIKFWVSW